MYDRLSEFHAIIEVFTHDADLLYQQLDLQEPLEIDSDIGGKHRSYVRAVFALIEGVLYQHQQLLLHLHNKGEISISPDLLAKIREEKAFLPLPEKPKIVAKAYNCAFKPACR